MGTREWSWTDPQTGRKETFLYPTMAFDFRLQGSPRESDYWEGHSIAVSSIGPKQKSLNGGSFVMQPNKAYSLAVQGKVAGTVFHVRKGSKITLTVKESSAQPNGPQRKS